MLLISSAVALIAPFLLMPGFVNDNLGGDFSYFEIVDGAEIERVNLIGVAGLFASMFLPVFIVVVVAVSVVRNRMRR